MTDGHLPDWIQVGRHGTRTLSGFADVHGDVRVGGARLVFGDQALSADDWRRGEAKNEHKSLMRTGTRGTAG